LEALFHLWDLSHRQVNVPFLQVPILNQLLIVAVSCKVELTVLLILVFLITLTIALRRVIGLVYGRPLLGTNTNSGLLVLILV